MKALLLISVLMLAQSQASPSIAGKWLWQGQAGWQRIVLDLKVQGTRLTGVVRMGAGGGEPKSSKDYWEYFFDPTDFKILNGKIEGSAIYFEQEARKFSPGATVMIPTPLPIPNLARGNPYAVTSKFIYRGRIEENRMVLTRETVSQAEDPWVIGNHKIEFSLERMK
jgi:hypothetical protein